MGMPTSRGRSPVVRIRGTLNQEKYMSKLQEHVLPFTNTHHPGNKEFVYQHD